MWDLEYLWSAWNLTLMHFFPLISSLLTRRSNSVLFPANIGPIISSMRPRCFNWLSFSKCCWSRSRCQFESWSWLIWFLKTEFSRGPLALPESYMLTLSWFILALFTLALFTLALFKLALFTLALFTWALFTWALLNLALFNLAYLSFVHLGFV